MAGMESNSRGSDIEDALAMARLLREKALKIARRDPGTFRLLEEVVKSNFSEICAVVGLSANAESFGEPSDVPTNEATERDRTGGAKESKEFTWNKVRRSLALDYLILSCLVRANNERPVIVDEIVDFVSIVFPIQERGQRSSLISKLSRLRNDKGCLVGEEGRKGIGYKISQGGREYLAKLSSAYLTTAELDYLKTKIRG